MSATRNCANAECRRRIYPRRCSVPNRHKHGGRGLCMPCYTATQRAGLLDDFARITRPSGAVVEEWASLNEQGLTRQQVAAALGIKPDSLDRALQRARAAA